MPDVLGALVSDVSSLVSDGVVPDVPCAGSDNVVCWCQTCWVRWCPLVSDMSSLGSDILHWCQGLM
ncbi:MAG: hypothetical protein LBK00_11600 [Treponema sp.]|nr:hypothetical protein [Treponema sp.]